MESLLESAETTKIMRCYDVNEYWDHSFFKVLSIQSYQNAYFRPLKMLWSSQTYDFKNIY